MIYEYEKTKLSSETNIHFRNQEKTSFYNASISRFFSFISIKKEEHRPKPYRIPQG